MIPLGHIYVDTDRDAQLCLQYEEAFLRKSVCINKNGGLFGKALFHFFYHGK